MRKTLTIIAAFIALVAISINLYKLIQNDHKSNSRNSTITTIVSTTPTTYMKIVSTTLALTTEDPKKSVYLSLRSQFDPDISLNNETQGNSWLLTQDGLRLQIDLISGENSPYSSDAEPEVKALTSNSFANPMYRIALGAGSYFYSDRYFRNTCGESFCSSGTIAVKEGMYLEVNCQANSPNSLDLCDKIVSNLEVNST